MAVESQKLTIAYCMTSHRAIEVPYKVMGPLLIQRMHSLSALNELRLVNKNFKLLVGFCFDEAITQVFKKLLPIKNENSTKENVLNSITRITLRNLDSGLFKFVLKLTDGTISKRYFKLHPERIENLKTFHECEAFVRQIVKSIQESPFDHQINLKFSKEMEGDMHHRIFDKSYEKWQKIIKECEISELYFPKSNRLIIEGKKTDKLTIKTFFDAIYPGSGVEEGLFNAVNEFLEEVSVIVEEDRFGLMMNPKLLQIMSKEKLKEVINLCFQQDYHKFIFGSAFPDIWPENLGELGKEKCGKSFNYALIKTLAKSVTFIPQSENIYLVSCDPVLRQFVLNRLENPESNLKQDMENICTKDSLIVCKKLFPEIWLAV